MAASTREALRLRHDMGPSDLHAVRLVACYRRTGAALPERRARKTTRPLTPPRWRPLDAAPDALPAECRDPAPT